MEIDLERCRALGEKAREALSRMEPDPFTDPRFYPPPSDDEEAVARYFLVMVAMDHRLSRPGRPYEARLEDGFYHGADLLYRLGMEKYLEDPGFFAPSRLASITAEEVASWLTPPGRPELRPVDLELRTILLRDLGRKVQLLYGDSAMAMIEESRGMLRGGGQGFIDRLKALTAFSDPVEKKPFLLAKFLERRGLLRVADPWDKEVPVDNHLTRIALRVGLVRPPSWMQEALLRGRRFSWEDDAMLRLAVRRAYKEAARSAGIDPFLLDDLLWLFGRRCCPYLASRASCSSGCSERCRAVGGCLGEKCLFHDICVSAGVGEKPTEHLFLDTWYY